MTCCDEALNTSLVLLISCECRGLTEEPCGQSHPHGPSIPQSAESHVMRDGWLGHPRRLLVDRSHTARLWALRSARVPGPALQVLWRDANGDSLNVRET